MYPSERYANILKVLPAKKRRRVAEYVDEVYHQGDKLSLYGVRTWKELVQHLVEFESGTKYATDMPPIQDYVLHCKMVKELDELTATGIIAEKVKGG